MFVPVFSSVRSDRHDRENKGEHAEYECLYCPEEQFHSVCQHREYYRNKEHYDQDQNLTSEWISEKTECEAD